MFNRLSVVIVIIVSLGLSACEVDPCADGNCEEVTSKFKPGFDCAKGFEGDNCQLRTIEKFLGMYSEGKGGCELCRKIDGKLVIEEIPHDLLHVSLEDNILSEPFVAKVNAWQFEILPQQNVFIDPTSGKRYEVEVSGKGWIDLSKNQISYKFENHGCQYSFPYKPIKEPE